MSPVAGTKRHTMTETTETIAISFQKDDVPDGFSTTIEELEAEHDEVWIDVRVVDNHADPKPAIRPLVEMRAGDTILELNGNTVPSPPDEYDHMTDLPGDPIQRNGNSALVLRVLGEEGYAMSFAKVSRLTGLDERRASSVLSSLFLNHLAVRRLGDSRPYSYEINDIGRAKLELLQE